MQEQRSAVRTFSELITMAREAASRHGPRTIAIAGADQRESVLAAAHVAAEGLARCVLVGDEARIQALAEAEGVSLAEFPVLHETDPVRIARAAATLVGKGEADLLMKGRVDTAAFMRGALDKDAGLRTGCLLSHTAVFQMPSYDRLIMVTDAGVVVAPTLEQKAEIIQNAVAVAHRLGLSTPRVAVLAATDTVNLKIKATVEAAILAKMAERGQITGCIVDGPLSVDTAMSPETAQFKGIDSPVAGQADILVVPDIEAGNMLGKAMNYFAGGSMAGVVMGARCPLVVVSRSDSEETKQISIALGVLMASRTD